MAFSHNTFGLVDYGLFGLTLLASAIIGFYFALRGRQKRHVARGPVPGVEKRVSFKDSPAEVLMGGRKMPVLPTAMSLLTSFLSGITILAMPAESYQRGILFWISRVVGTFVALLVSAFIVLPIFYQFRPTSAYQYFELRFGSKFLRRCSSALYILFMLFYTAIVMYAPAVALSGVTGVNTWVFVISVGTICIFYTSFGGLKAVVWADTLQAGIMLIGIITLFVKGTIDAGGPSRVWSLASEHGHFEVAANVDPNPFQYMNLWSSIFGGIGFWLSMLSFNQIALQRYLSLPTLADARRVIWINIPTYMFMMTFADLLGIVIFAYYYQCDPLGAKLVETKDQLVIFFALDVFDNIPGLPGLFLACLFSGTLSTVSSGINSIAAVSWEDFFCTRFTTVTPRRQALVIKGAGFIIGAIAMLLAFLAKPLGGIIKTLLSVMGATAGPLVGLFLLGILFPSANRRGALAGMAVSFLITVWISVGNAYYKPYADYALPLSTARCAEWNVTIPVDVFSNGTESAVNATGNSDGYSPLTGFYKIYAISDVLFSVIGIVLVLIVGLPASYLLGDSAEDKGTGSLSKEAQDSLTVKGIISRAGDGANALAGKLKYRNISSRSSGSSGRASKEVSYDEGYGIMVEDAKGVVQVHAQFEDLKNIKTRPLIAEYVEEEELVSKMGGGKPEPAHL